MLTNFPFLTSISALFVGLNWALTQEGGPAKPKSESTVSSVLQATFLSPHLTPPGITTDFLDSATFFGGARTFLAADDLFQDAFEWGLGLTTVQYDAVGKLKSSEFIPGPSKDFHHSWEDGAYALAVTCHKFGDSIVEKLNKECGVGCGKVYTLGLVWGTFKGMDFDKDTILSAACSALEVTKSDACFESFPKNCTIKAVGEQVSLWSEEATRIATKSTSKEEIVAAIKKYGQEKAQNITLPSS